MYGNLKGCEKTDTKLEQNDGRHLFGFFQIRIYYNLVPMRYNYSENVCREHRNSRISTNTLRDSCNKTFVLVSKNEHPTNKKFASVLLRIQLLPSGSHQAHT